MRVMASFLILACQCGATGMFVRGVHTARSIKMSLINACKSSPVFHYTSLSSLLVLVYAQGRSSHVTDIWVSVRGGGELLSRHRESDPNVADYCWLSESTWSL